MHFIIKTPVLPTVIPSIASNFVQGFVLPICVQLFIQDGEG